MVAVSVYVLTYNNKRTLERCLKSLGWADELIVVDSFSDDGSFELARAFTDKVFRRKFAGHREQYQYAADLTSNEWIMFVDADEEVPPELVEEIRKELNGRNEGFDGYFIYRRTYYLGRWIRHGGWYPDGEIRLYRRDRGSWEGGLHARVSIEGNFKYLKNHYRHYTYRDISDQIHTLDRYSSIAVEDMVNKARPFKLLNLILNPPFRFFKEYIFKLGFLDGIPGLIIAVSTFYYVFVKHTKLWEHYFVVQKKKP